MKNKINFFANDISVYQKTKNTPFLSKRKKFLKMFTTMCIIVVVFILIQALIAGVYWILQQLGMHEKTASLVAGLGDAVVGVIATVAIIYQLGQDKEAEQKLKDIEEAKFILQYNQAFVQDENMCDIQATLEKNMLDRNERKECDNQEKTSKQPVFERNKPELKNIIDDDNRQKVINYLVYLEGLAALVFRNVLTIENIDDLLAYRFFLAMNNEDVQKDQLIPYAPYYKGCFKLYEHWKLYRKIHNLEILQSETSLDRWWEFEDYINCNIVLRKCTDDDSLESIASIIYNTDPYIYPAAFGNISNAKKILPELMKEKNGIFSKKNIRLAIYGKKIVGVATILHSDNIDEISSEFVKKYKKILPNFEDVCNRYFNTFTNTSYSKAPYLLTLCVEQSYRKKEIGTILTKSVLREFKNENIQLEVLKYSPSSLKQKENTAIHMYEKLGFQCVKERKGYSLDKEQAPQILEMKCTEKLLKEALISKG